jgi:hypothetical protein
MGELSMPRIEPLAQNTDLDKGPPKQGTPRKRAVGEPQPPPPSVESDDTVEEVHKIDELA